jgi:hypothetical protein
MDAVKRYRTKQVAKQLTNKSSPMASRSMKLKRGRVLDDALIQKLASEAERGYDLSRARRIVLRQTKAEAR